MRALILTPLMILSGCIFGTNAVGTWEGTCTVEAYGYEVDVDFEYEIEEDKGGDLAGEGEFSYYGYTFEGDAEGDRDGTEAKVEIDGEYQGYSNKLELDGEIEGNEYTGDCEMGGADGEFEADR